MKILVLAFFLLYSFSLFAKMTTWSSQADAHYFYSTTNGNRHPARFKQIFGFETNKISNWRNYREIYSDSDLNFSNADAILFNFWNELNIASKTVCKNEICRINFINLVLSKGKLIRKDVTADISLTERTISISRKKYNSNNNNEDLQDDGKVVANFLFSAGASGTLGTISTGFLVYAGGVSAVVAGPIGSILSSFAVHLFTEYCINGSGCNKPVEPDGKKVIDKVEDYKKSVEPTSVDNFEGEIDPVLHFPIISPPGWDGGNDIGNICKMSSSHFKERIIEFKIIDNYSSFGITRVSNFVNIKSF